MSETPNGASSAQGGFDCVIEPFQVVKLATSAVGVIDKLYVDRGDLVARGQLLGKLVDAVEQANLSLAQERARDSFSIGALDARLVFLHAREGRANALIENGFVTKAQRDEVLSDARVAEQQRDQAILAQKVAQLEVNQAKKVIEQKQVRSPLDGTVMEVLLRPGEYRDDKSPILKLAQTDPLRVEVFVPTSFYGRIHSGDSATVKSEGPKSDLLHARVNVVDRVLDAASGTFGVRLLIANPKHRLPGGLQCKVHFDSLT
jgi:RND family efflux transporter MFP subunit